MAYASRFQFGPFTLDCASFRLERGATPVALTPKALELLSLLVSERRRGLTKQELFDRVWPDTALTDNTLTQRIRELREALGDSPHDPVYIRTIPRVGYQFVAEVTDIGPAEEVALAVVPPAAPSTIERPTAHPEAAERAELSSWSRIGRRRAGLSVALGALAAMVITGVWAYYGRSAPAVVHATRAGGRIMLAVLPFQNISGDPEQEYFADGLTEELITELGRLDPEVLGVIARTSSMTYKGTQKSAGAVARELGVDYVLEGSVRREADRVRIVAQLIRADDQTHVWAERYDRELRSILALQSDIARAVAVETSVRLSSANAVASTGPPAVHPDAYHAYLRGRYFLNQRTGQAIQKGLAQFHDAVRIDAAYAQAYAGLADAYELSASYAGASPRDSIERGLAAAERALELNPDLAEAHTSLGVIHASYTHAWDASEAAFRRALALNANYALARKGYSELLSYAGRHDEAIAQARRAAELDPLSPIMQSVLGVTYYRARRFDEAMHQMRQTLETDPHYMLAHFNLGMILAATTSYDDAAAAFQRAGTYAPDFAEARAFLGNVYAAMGRTAEARDIARELRRRAATRYVSPYALAIVHAGLGDREQALADLEQAFEDRTWLIALLKVDPVWDSLRGEERFAALVRRLKFSDSPS